MVKPSRSFVANHDEYGFQFVFTPALAFLDKGAEFELKIVDGFWFDVRYRYKLFRL